MDNTEKRNIHLDIGGASDPYAVIEIVNDR